MSCKDCERRFVGCHSSCEDYARQVAKYREAKQKRIQDSMADSYTVRTTNERKYQWKKRNK